VSGIRLLIGAIVMGIAVPVTIFLLLGLTTLPQFFAVAATTFLAWGIADLLSTILEKPRLRDRSPRAALKEDWERRSKE
jgi:hypothetical protein